jgi:hypothetical protein
MIDETFYDKIIHLKTGILFGMACRLGAIAAETDDKLTEASYRYGVRIGEMYQIADDLQELKQHLFRQSIHPDRMATLAPIFLHYHGEMEKYVVAILRGEYIRWDKSAAACFAAVAKLMELDITKRLKSTLGIMEEYLPDNDYSKAVRSAPGDIIRMFNESEDIPNPFLP